MPRWYVKRGYVEGAIDRGGNGRTPITLQAWVIGTEQGNPASAEEVHLLLSEESEGVCFEEGVDVTDGLAINVESFKNLLDPEQPSTW